MDLMLRNLRLAETDQAPVDIGIDKGLIAAIAPNLGAQTETIDMAGRLAIPGFVESHIHLDKSCILERCKSDEGTLDEAIREVSQAKADFTVEDIQARARRTLEKAILQGTTRMRTHVEVDPGIGLKGIDAIMPLVDEYRWAIELEICVFPQEGLLNNPGTDALMQDALTRGAHVVGGCPYTDSDPRGQIERIFDLAVEYDVDVDFHLDFDTNPEGMTVDDVCALTDRHRYGGRVTIGHVSKLSALSAETFDAVTLRLASAGVAVTVLPATDLFLMGGDRDHDIVRGVAPVDRLSRGGVTCALSTNNVLNPFTPFGDCSLVRMANLYANIGRIGTTAGMDGCFSMVTQSAADVMRLADYGIAVGNPADIVVLDCETPVQAVQEIAPPLYGFKRGRRTFTREPAQLHRP